MVAQEFLMHGGYRVRGTVRSKTNEAKIGPLKTGLGALFNLMELVEADLLDEASISAACAGSTYVVHTASPFIFEGTEDEIVKPAVDGTNAVMKACSEHGVKRVVVTSSGAAIFIVDAKDAPAEGSKWDESYWTDLEKEGGCNVYFKAKTLAEKAAWDYVEKQPEGEKFELVVINPFFVQGPSMCAIDGTSEGWMTSWIDGSRKTITKTWTQIVDVRDVALAHLKAI